jgi:branched-chain amino acid transport system substrate-binding protein
MKHTHQRRALSALITLALVATACGNDDDGASVSAADDAPPATDAAATPATDAADEPADDSGDAAEGVRLGILAECEGAFGGFNEDTVAGTTLALINEAGATSNSTTTALDGFSGAEVAGVPIELVGIGCGDDTSDRAIQEIRTLVEQDGANVVIGPLSGDEGIAVAQYALDHPEVTFVNGIAGAQDATLHVQAPNFFRFNGDGAQWNAGVGDTVYNDGGWKTAAVIADDYGFGWTSAAGFVADFCAAGGDVIAQVFPPLGTTDYSSFVQQLPDPDEVDGYFWVVGGTGTNASLEAFLNAKGDLTGDQHAGNLFFSPALAEALGSDIAGAYVGGFASLPGDISTPEITAYLASADAAWETLSGGTSGNEPAPPSQALGFGFAYGYYSGTLAFVQALASVDGDLSNNHEALRGALSSITVDAPYGPLSLDDNRQAIIDTFVAQLVVDEATGDVVQKTVYIVPGVDQTFGGTYSNDTDPPERDNTPCEQKSLPWQGNLIPVVDGVPQR